MNQSILQYDTVALTPTEDAIRIIDQTELPAQLVFLDLYTCLLYTSGRFRRAVSDRWYEYEHLLVYFLFRYFLKSVYTGDCLTPVQLAVVSSLIVGAMDLTRFEACLLYTSACTAVYRQTELLRSAVNRGPRR